MYLVFQAAALQAVRGRVFLHETSAARLFCLYWARPGWLTTDVDYAACALDAAPAACPGDRAAGRRSAGRRPGQSMKYAETHSRGPRAFRESARASC